MIGDAGDEIPVVVGKIRGCGEEPPLKDLTRLTGRIGLGSSTGDMVPGDGTSVYPM